MKRFQTGAVLVAVLAGLELGAQLPATADVGRVAPDFALKDLAGHTVHLSDFRGKAVLLNFWATWCPPCRFEIPAIVKVYDHFRSKGLVVLGVSMDDDPRTAVPGFIADFKKSKHVDIDYPILQGDDQVADLYGGIHGIPTTFLIDRKGRIEGEHIGPPGDTLSEVEANFTKDVEKLL